LFLEITLLHIEVQEFYDVLDKQKWVDFINLTGLGQRSVFADVNQGKILGDPCHEVYVFFLDFSIFGCVCGQARTSNDQTS
jgi:hypothetical protein